MRVLSKQTGCLKVLHGQTFISRGSLLNPQNVVQILE
jgi:hypothetical protein